MKKLLKGTLVISGAVILSTLAIQASDYARSIENTLTGLTADSNGPCGEFGILLQFGGHDLCVDQYEAVPTENCTYANTESVQYAKINIENTQCRALSAPNLSPWRYVSLSEAQQLCARSNKRLPTDREWYQIAIQQTDDAQCNTKSGTVALTGTVNCYTNTNVYDIVGNVWEWVDATVVNGVFEDVSLPESGYVQLIDSRGLVINTSADPSDTYGSDYAWSINSGVAGIIKGGFYDSDTDAGIYAQNLSVPLDLRVPGVGFRCVWDI